MVTVRSAFVSECASLEALQWRASLQNSKYREALLKNPDAIVLPVEQIIEGRVFVAEQDGEILGFYAVLPREDGNTELDGLFVEPNVWRQGIGSELVDHSCALAKRAGARYLHVVGNPQAESFYRACGFELVGTERTRFGDGMLMKRAL